MNFLALAQRACVECGVASGTAIAVALPTTAGATGSVGRVVSWVGDAWNELQMDHDDWDWMRSSVLLGGGVTVPTIAGQASYPLACVSCAPAHAGETLVGTTTGTVGVAVDSFGKWDRETFRCFPTAYGYQGEDYLDEIPFDTWRDSYMFGAQRSVQTRPVAVAIGPDQSVNLGPPPNGLYTFTADYFVAPSLLVNDTDVPEGLPTRFHLLIVYRAMMKYAGYESAPEVYTRGSEESGRMHAQLMALRAPRMSFGGSLA